jgi:putative ABC transport system permease protein
VKIWGVPRLLLRAGINYQLRHRWQALLALIGISMGVAVVLAVDLANGAARASFALSSAQLRGEATHRIIANTGKVPQTLYSELFTSPNHPPMAPVITSRVTVDGQPGRFQLLGLDLFAEGAFRKDLPLAIRGTSSLTDWLTSTDAVAISRSAARQLQLDIDNSIIVKYQRQSHPLLIFTINDLDSVASSNLLVVDIATAQAINAMPGFISHIDLILDEAAIDWLTPRLPSSIKLIDIEQQTEGIVGLSASFELNLTAMSLLALLVGVFLIFNAMSFSIVQRRTLLGRLRSLGVQSGELYRVIFAEALVLALIGTLAGIVLGIWLGQGLTQIVAATVSELYYDVSSDAMQINGLSLLKAVVLGIGGTLFATWLPAYQASRTPPLTTLSRAALEHSAQRQLPRLAMAGVVLIIVGLIIAFIIPGGLVLGFVGLFIFLFGAVFITPLSLPLAHLLLSRLPLGGVWRMAIRDIDRHISRLGTAAAALMVALAASVGVAVMVDSMRSSVSDWLQDLLSADLYIAAEGFQDGAFLPEQVVNEVPLLDSVIAVSQYRDHEILIGKRSTRLVAARLSPPSRAGFNLVEQSDKPWHDFEKGDVLISEPLAHRLQLDPGDFLELPTIAGDKDFRIAAVFRDYASEHGRVFLDLEHYQNNWLDFRIDTLALFSEDGDAAALKQLVDQRFAKEHTLEYTAAREIYHESMAVFDRTFRITEVLRVLSVLVAFIGILSALMAVQLERRKEFAVLRALGLTRLQISLLIIIESVILGLLAAIMALPTGLGMAWVLTDAIQLRAFGWTMPFLLSVPPLLWTLLVGICAAFLASLYPAWVASQGNPAPQLRED